MSLFCKLLLALLLLLPIQAEAISVASGAFNTNTTTGNQSVSGVGFQPQYVFFWGGRNGTGLGTVVDFATSKGMATGSTNRGSSFSQITDQDISAVTGAVEGVIFTRCYQEATDNAGAGPGTVTLALDFVSNDSDGFTVNVVTADATSRRVFYFAINGLTSATVGTYQTPATTTGNQAITGLGFKPDLLMVIAYGGPLSASPASGDTEEIFGFAASASVTGASDIEPTQVSTSGWDTSDTVLETSDLVLAPSLGATRMQHKLVTMDSGGFTINRVVGNTAVTDWAYTALQGLQVAIGSFLQPTAGGAQNQSVSGLAFTPKLVLFQSEMTTASGAPVDHFQDSATAGHSTGVAISSSNRRVHSTAKRTARGTANVIHRADETLILTAYTVNQASPSTATILAEADFVSMDASGFTIHWNSIDAIARNVMYLAIGDAAGGGGGCPLTLTLLGVGC